MTRYRVKSAHIQNLWLARTSTKQFIRNGAHFNTTHTPTAAHSFKSQHKAQDLLKRWIENTIEHNKYRPKSMPKPLDPKSCYFVEEYDDESDDQ